MNTLAQIQADRLMVEWIHEWLRQEFENGGPTVSFQDFLEQAIDATARGLTYEDAGEESYERSYARAHGDAPDARWGEFEEERSERAWTYSLPHLVDVLRLLDGRGFPISTGDLIE